MKLGAVFLGYTILLLLLYIFGIVSIADNPILNILINGDSWESSFFSISLGLWKTSKLTLIGVMGFVVGGGSYLGSKLFGIVPNRFLIFGGLSAFILTNYLSMITPIIDVFPENIKIIGYVIYGILSFILIWTTIEFWGGIE
jgi:hypothetical protein